MVKKGQKLFAEFPAVSTQQWEAAIEADLKGADYDKKLVWRTAEGFNVRPYYRTEDLEGIVYLGSAPGVFPYVRGTRKCNGWKVHQTITVTDVAKANEVAVKALAAGAGSLGLNVKGDNFTAADLDTLLGDIDIASTELVFCGSGLAKVASLMIEKAKKEKIASGDAKYSFTIDPLINRLSVKGQTMEGSNCLDKATELTLRAEAEGFGKMRFVGVNGHKFHESGSTITQELAFTLAVGHEYLVALIKRGLTPDQAAGTIRFSMAVSSNYFMEIAKFRAARMLWANIVAAYNPQRGCSQKMRQHAVTSRWNITAYDPYVNMLRGTTEAMSATIAGVHSLEVTPFDAAYSAPTDFSSRIARNAQLLLKHESHFDQVADPSGGSYYIETLTNSIAEGAWKLFREVEEKGGYIEAFKAGFIQDQVEASAARKNINIATRREILIGTNQYPNFGETSAEGAEFTKPGVAASCSCGCDTPVYRTLKPYRAAQAFEELRLAVDQSGRKPKAFMLTCGSLGMARARSQFACNFFACAGIRVEDNNFFASVEEGAKAALAAKADIVVICAADDDYADLAPKAKAILGDKAILVVAGAPASQAELEAEGVTNFISVRSNLLESLKSYVKMLGI